MDAKNKKHKDRKKYEKVWKLRVGIPIRVVIDLSMLSVVITTLYMGFVANRFELLLVPLTVVITYIIFIYKGFYDMKVELTREGVLLIFFPFVRLLLPYQKISSIEIAERKWRDYLTGYGCKIKRNNGKVEIYFRSRMSGKTVVIQMKKSYKKFRKVEITLDDAENFVEELKLKLKKKP